MPDHTSVITSLTNQYLGINAHLHSHFLHTEPEGWEEFHSSHITDLTRALNQHLPSLGYIARQERSLQIRHFDEKPSSPISDVLISRVPQPALSPASAVPHTQTAFNVPAATLLEPDPVDVKSPFAVKIYELHDDVPLSGAWRETPVVWIELLSPSNKSGAGYRGYVAKREALLANWLVFVEIDYLHGVSTTLTSIPDYHPAGRDQQPREDAYPYHLWMIDPRIPPDDPRSGAIAPFTVDQPIPALMIPLNPDTSFTFDFNAVYHQTFKAQPAFGMAVNYAAPPIAMNEDYNQRDQEAIRARMDTLQRLVESGINLADGPYPIDSDRIKSSF